MKTRSILIVLFITLFGGCADNKQLFKPALERALLELTNSLEDKIDNDELLSIEFHSFNNIRQGLMMRIFVSNHYSSGKIDGYVKYGNNIVALYNLRDDYFELVNKNNIMFFVDTIVGFKDSFSLQEPKKQYFYSIFEEDSIKMVTFDGDFPSSGFIRKSRCPSVIFELPKEYWFNQDSIQAEENLKYYQKEVEYYRNKVLDK